ncbi:MAG TPA: DUF3995 domain-containing protein [Afipia sp.]
MSLIAFAMFVVLTSVAAMHVAWGAGIRWPCRTELDLVSMVIGYQHHRMPSPNQCYIAALAIYVPGVLALMLAGLVDAAVPPSMVTLAGSVAALAFAGRGIAGYLPAWRARFPREPFASLDRQFYSPLCLLLAAGFMILLFNGMRG